MKNKEVDIDALFKQARKYLDHLVGQSNTDQAWKELQSRLQEPALKKMLERVRRFETGSGRLRITDRKDILALLLYVKGRYRKLGEGICGMTRILKLLFLAQEELEVDALVRNPYRFQPYKLGPFTPEVYDDLEVLRRAGLVKRETLDEDGFPVLQQDNEIDEGFKLNNLTTLYRLTAKGKRFARALLANGRKRKRNLEPGLTIIKGQFGAMPLHELLRYIYTRYPEYTTESVILEKILGKRK
ncbi:hypothetical protein CH330_00550 [candidate division WOR-3 bacterium JGI_Cruoil_03_51_56]|uniref:Antitoxin SocA-like Panacea domain-containing protein n=1 Tax=candidate division WOR-3 bacterium JGI_Cruoil_03_51_56 TaxID=1973747 RepID=A0A235BYH1_UNCW3|nr:MAG: hypothetical protein CH330_00550 [candidate division WOR-3 bacterium JGI_Cruoil_03_51_56]